MNPAAKHDVFEAIADPTRRKILRLLSEKNLPIAGIVDQFSVSRTAIVKHLTILTNASLVREEKRGREKIYSINPEPLTEVKQWLSYFDRFWDNKLAILKYTVETNQNKEK